MGESTTQPALMTTTPGVPQALLVRVEPTPLGPIVDMETLMKITVSIHLNTMEYLTQHAQNNPAPDGVLPQFIRTPRVTIHTSIVMRMIWL